MLSILSKIEIMFERSVLQLLRGRILEPRRYIQVLMGPRQVGKTTLITQMMQKKEFPMVYHAADGVPAGNTQWLEQIWEAGRLELKTQNLPSLVLVVDEIQKLHQWSETVKRLWDEDSREGRNLKVILLGSSQILVQKGLSESLGGRFEVIRMGHWSYQEMRDAFGIDPRQYAWFGGYPGSIPLMEDESRWRNYIRDSLVETAISRDIFQMTRIDKPVLLRNLFELGCSYSGQVLSYTKILGQLKEAGNSTTLAHYLRLLDTAGLLGGLEKYSDKTVRQRSSSPKFQVHNPALRTIRTPQKFQDSLADPQEWGRIVEGVVGAGLLNEALTRDFRIYYWREGDHEVDFVIEYQEKIAALEVKSSHVRKLPGLKKFRDRYPSCKSYIIGRDGIPWEEFLLLNPLDLL